jgi:hypothetical protein
MFNHEPIEYKQMSFVANGGKFKLYTVQNGLLSCERMIVIIFAKESSVNVQRTNTKIVGVLQGSTLGPERTIHSDSSKQQIQQVQIRFSLALWKTHIVV